MTDIRRGQKVWDEERHEKHGWQPNGVITYVNYSDHEVRVTYPKSTDPKERTSVSYPWSRLEGNWTERFGGMWRLNDESLGRVREEDNVTEGSETGDQG